VNLVVYDKNNAPLWATGTWAVPVVERHFPPGWTCVEQTAKTEVRLSRDIPGNSYLIVRQGATEGVYFCSTRCQNDSACVAYSYEGSRQLCSLKDGYSSSVSKRGFASGRVLRKRLVWRNPPKPR
jgi:PAN domain